MGRVAGFAYLEVLVAVAVLAVLLAPAVEGLHAGLRGSEASAARLAEDARLRAKMEEVLAQPFDRLAGAAEAAGNAAIPADAFSDPVSDPARRVVFLSYYDGDRRALVATPTGLIWVRVRMTGRADDLRSLVAR